MDEIKGGDLSPETQTGETRASSPEVTTPQQTAVAKSGGQRMPPPPPPPDEEDAEEGGGSFRPQNQRIPRHNQMTMDTGAFFEPGSLVLERHRQTQLVQDARAQFRRNALHGLDGRIGQFGGGH